MSSDFLIVGSGISGLFLAEKLSELGTVTLVTKGAMREANTNFAQGGIAAVRDFENDTLESHVQDTMEAGSFHNDKEAVEFLVKKADFVLQQMNDMGIVFDENPTREGGHSFSRIWHKDDFSGEYIEESLILRIQKNANINIWDRAYVFELIVEDGECKGVLVQDHNDEIHPLESQNTILAMGGAGYLFEKTTNPKVTVGEGISLAILHGIELGDLEFIQFHPTVLDIEREPMFLLSEALRGEGAKLVNADGKEFMLKYHEQGDLAPRDIVTRAIREEQKKGQVYLDIRHRSVDFLRRRFPNIAYELRKYDLKLERDLIPVTPAAHYTCGGIKTDLQGRTNLKNLFALGEVACTGIHGANRLASNSLLEGVVFAESIYWEIKNEKLKMKNDEKAASYELRDGSDEKPLEKSKNMNKKIVQNVDYLPVKTKHYEGFLKEIRRIMWEYFGIIRNLKQMEKGLKELHELEAKDISSHNIQLAALAIASACIERKESLGCHWVNLK